MSDEAIELIVDVLERHFARDARDTEMIFRSDYEKAARDVLAALDAARQPKGEPDE